MHLIRLDSKIMILLSSLFMVFVMLTSNGAYAENDTYEIVIEKGAANPSFDPQYERPEEWYNPTKLTIKLNDTVSWINQDAEKHSVTSGMSSGRTGFVKGDLGTPDGLFDSGLFEEGNKWSYKFTLPGTFQYFCTIHPWMFGVIVVEGDPPAYPHDMMGNKVTLPAMTLTSEGKYHVGAAWSPDVLKTGEQATFINDFFDKGGTVKQHLLKYDFVLVQNGKEIHRSFGFSVRGSETKYFAFSEPGPVLIRFENIGGNKESVAEFNTMVYSGSSNELADAIISTNKFDPIIIEVGIYAIIIGLLVGTGSVALWYKKHWNQR